MNAKNKHFAFPFISSNVLQDFRLKYNSTDHSGLIVCVCKGLKSGVFFTQALHRFKLL